MKRFLFLLVFLAACATSDHSARAPRPGRATYRHAQRQHSREREHRPSHSIPWN